MKNYFQHPVIILIGLIFISCNFHQKKISPDYELVDEPNWYLDMPSSDDFLYAKGTGDGKTYAVMDALFDLCVKEKSTITSSTEVITIDEAGNQDDIEKWEQHFSSNANCIFGNVKVGTNFSNEEFSTNLRGGDIDGESELKYIFNLSGYLSYSNGNQNFSIKKNWEEQGLGENIEFQMVSEASQQNCTINSILTELKLYGITIEDIYIDDEMSFYVLLKGDRIKIIENKTKSYDELNEGL